MSKSSKSQWDFGELFPVAATRKILSVSELTTQVRDLLEKQIGLVWVSGEITHFPAHMYSTLKDAGAQWSCVLSSGKKLAERQLLADAQKVLLQAAITVSKP